MCSFAVVTDQEISQEKFSRGLAKIKYRGPDQTRIIREDGYYFGFNRLAIMGLTDEGMQPFVSDKGIVVCNGELYGFRSVREKLIQDGYTFKSDSDCEIIWPLYEKYGLDMFRELDSEFACVIYDKEKKMIIAARDPIGIRPMFYGHTEGGKICFASEAKALIDMCSDVLPFPPGYYYANGEFVSYYDATKASVYHDDLLEKVYKEIHDRLTDGILKRLDADTPIGFMLSGGLDSSLVCSVASKHSDTPIRTFAIGMDIDAIDLKYAKQVADYIGSIHTEVIMTKDQVLDALEEVIYHLETYDITTIRASIGMYLLSKWIHENTDIKVIMTGEVSDELFGYKYTDFAPSALEFQKESEKRIRELYMYDVLRADRCISGCSMEARVPFADLKFVDYVMGLDPRKKMNVYGKGKYLLRKAFEGDYLPESILMREKAAFSDAVGHSMVDDLKELAEEKYTDRDVEDAKIKYPKHTPFTKESLMYREIFEKFYPGKSDMIVDFWMPNKAWENCDVDDPSARVLKNYGESGK